MLRETTSIRTGVLLVCSVLPMCAQEPATPAAANVGGAATVTGSGTPQFVPLWRTTTSLGNSGIFQKGMRLGIGTKAPGAQLDVRALTLIPAFSALGASGPPGSDQNASAGISSKGGDADPDSGLSVGGAGVVGTGGASSLFAGSAGSGGSFTGGSGGASSAFGGAGVVEREGPALRARDLEESSPEEVAPAVTASTLVAPAQDALPATSLATLMSRAQ